MDDFQPDLVVGTGGYASYPVVHEAAKRGIPTAVHESNAVPGLTTKLLAKVADRVMVGFEDSRSPLPAPGAGGGDRHPGPGRLLQAAPARRPVRQLGITDDRPLVLSYLGQPGGRG